MQERCSVSGYGLASALRRGRPACARRPAARSRRSLDRVLERWPAAASARCRGRRCRSGCTWTRPYSRWRCRSPQLGHRELGVTAHVDAAQQQTTYRPPIAFAIAPPASEGADGSVPRRVRLWWRPRSAPSGGSAPSRRNATGRRSAAETAGSPGRPGRRRGSTARPRTAPWTGSRAAAARTRRRRTSPWCPCP